MAILEVLGTIFLVIIGLAMVVLGVSFAVIRAWAREAKR